ncbi:CHAT domain-containing protein [Streptomyces sp. MMS24-I2-30]|uniref:CHAT domain-containing protein n=1 Tax=Streptomyces sp. MMS24-I2-30 TaxID=3351564 RepID=UPI0038968951
MGIIDAELLMVRRRIERYTSTGSLEFIMEEAALAEVRRLLTATMRSAFAPRGADPDVFIPAQVTAGWLHWYRWAHWAAFRRAEYDPRYTRDRLSALALLVPVHAVHSDAVPESLHEALQLDDPGLRDDLPGWLEAAEDLAVHAGQAQEPDAYLPAIVTLQAMLAASPATSPERPAVHATLSRALTALHAAIPTPAAEEEALLHSRQAVAALGPEAHGHDDYRNRRIASLMKRYETKGDLSALIVALGRARATVWVMPHDAPHRGSALVLLGSILEAVFAARHDRRFLDEAMSVMEHARAALPVTDAERSELLTRLGHLHMDRYALFHPAEDDVTRLRAEEALDGPRSDALAAAPSVSVLTDLAEAIALGREALRVADSRAESRLAANYLLSRGLQLRYEQGGDPADLDEAVTRARAAHAVPGPEGDRLPLMHNLCGVLQLLHTERGDTNALEEAIAVAREAVEAAGKGHVGHAAHLWTLIVLLASRPGSGDADGEEIADCTDQALASATASVPIRLNIAWDAGRHYAVHGEWVLAARYLAHGVGLLPQLVDGLGGQDQEHQLLRHTGIAPLAAACALNTGEPAAALELLERGRGVLSTLSHIPVAPTVPEELLRSGAHGPVVVLNNSAYRTDALLLTRDGLDVLPLPDVTPDAVAEWMPVLSEAPDQIHHPEATLADRLEGEERFRAGLAWLWDAIAAPVLDALGIGAPAPGRPLGRIWWCPTFTLSALPLHAAGHFGTAGGPAVLDRVISSYTPTVTALLRNQRAARARRPDPELLTVAMEHTPGQMSLPGARAEAEMLSSLFPGHRVLLNEAAGHARVLDALGHATRVHFACHGSHSRIRTDDICLRLHDRPLTTRDITALHTSGAELAFLSGCSTGRGHIALPDENLHLATAFHQAGFPQVIAAMWSISDFATYNLAREFYTSLGQGAGAASALHHAVHTLRAAYPANPSLWGAYIHLGA